MDRLKSCYIDRVKEILSWNDVFLLLIIGLAMFILGVAIVIMTVRFVVRKEHPLLSILFAILQCPCIYIPLKYTIGFWVARTVLLATFLFGIVVLVLSLKNIKMK